MERMMKVDRQSKERKLLPTSSVRVTIKGQIDPGHLQIFGYKCKTEKYIYPTRICTNCWRIGHSAKTCKSKKRCFNCAATHDEMNEETCKNVNKTVCANCKGDHYPTDPECPTRVRQNIITADMAVNRISYREAADKYPKQATSKPTVVSMEEFPPLEDKEAETTSDEAETKYTKADYRKTVNKLRKEAEKTKKTAEQKERGGQGTK
jgi:hypothetical protein